MTLGGLSKYMRLCGAISHVVMVATAGIFASKAMAAVGGGGDIGVVTEEEIAVGLTVFIPALVATSVFSLTLGRAIENNRNEMKSIKSQLAQLLREKQEDES